MIKRDEQSNPDSCLNKAAEDEPIFTLRATDVCAPGIIREWARQRIARRRNERGDSQILEALSLADAMVAWKDAQ